jgi:drug/metabolite transporter (DMT)-like permease
MSQPPTSHAAEPVQAKRTTSASGALPATAAEEEEQDKTVSSTVLLALVVAIWFCGSVVNATSTKVLMPLLGNQVDRPWLWITAAQLVCASIMSGITAHSVGWSANAATDRGKQRHDLLLISVCTLLGFITLNSAYSVMTVSLANTLRAMEPLGAVAWALMSGQGLGQELLGCVLTIVAGGCMACWGATDASAVGIILCMVCNMCFVCRTVAYKRVKSR